jgi:hypothetical protein
MNESAQYSVQSRTLPFCCLVAAICGVMACSQDANLGKGPVAPSDSGSHAGGDTHAGGVVTSAGTGGTPSSPSAGAAGTSSQAGSGGTLETAGTGSGGTGELPGDAGASGSGGSGDGNGVMLTAVYLPGSGVVRAKWHNGTDATIFLRGCATTDGWYREGDEWKKYGAFAVCANEGLEVEVAAGATYEDPAGGVPPARGDNVWRLVGPYGTGCTPGVKFSEANCGTLFEATSVNEITTN